MQTLTKQQVKTILLNAPQGSDKTKIVQALINNGYQLEGLNEQEEVKEPSYLERVGEQYKQLGERVKGAVEQGATPTESIGGDIKQLGRTTLRGVGAVAEGAFAPIIEAPVIKQTLDFIGEKLGNTEIGQKLAKKAQENPETAQDIMDIVNILTIGGGKAVEQPVKVGVEKAITTGKEALKTGIKTLKTKEAIKTATKVDELVGKITQGLDKDIPRAKKALSDIETTGIKSYKDLSSTLNNKVSDLSTKLDEILDQNTTKINLQDAKNIVKVGDKTVEHNFVNDALSQLDDYFTKTNDIVAKENIVQLKNKFNTEGIRIKDINDLARLHGEKLNAYNASGELASGLTKQAAENTRAGLKSTARDLFGDKVYGEIDSEISNVIRTRDLVDNVSKKVTQLQQKINKRGFGEKVGRLVFQIADKFTGGGLKGFVQSFVPRGEGLKIMNALDLEKSLNKNLKMLDNAINAKTENATIKALEGIINYIENPKMGLSIEDVSKNQSSEAFLKSQPTTNIVNKTPNKLIPNSTTKSLKGKGTIPEIADSIKQAKASGQSFDEWVKGQATELNYKNLQENEYSIKEYGKDFNEPVEYFRAGQVRKNGDIWLTDNEAGALQYSKAGGGTKVGSYIVQSKKPLIIDTAGGKYANGNIDINKILTKDEIAQGYTNNPDIKKKFIDYAKNNGYDAVQFADSFPDGEGGMRSLVVWNKNQIKTKSQLTDIWRKANKK